MINPLIDWTSSESTLLLNPRMPENELTKISAALKTINLPYHVWIATSGTKGTPKLAALSKEALLISAKAVSKHLNITKDDIWLNILPHFHVGGLGIHARSIVAGSKMFDYSHEKWDPAIYSDLLNKHIATWSSLVPTQVFDLVQHQIKPPKTLRGIIVGGGKLNEPLHAKAFDLGWKLYCSYGMTECCSQVATANSPLPLSPLVPLEHVAVRSTVEGFIEIQSKSLLTGYIFYNNESPFFRDPKIDGWFCSEDKGVLEDTSLKIFGRDEQFLKIGGESIDFCELEKIWEETKLNFNFSSDAVIIDMPDERLGRSIHLFITTEMSSHIEALMNAFNSRVLPIAKIRQVHTVAELPRTPLKKLLKEKLRNIKLAGCYQHDLLR